MALSTQNIVDAFNNSGFDAAGLTKFLTAAKLRTDLDGLNAQMLNLNAKLASVSVDIEQARADLQGKINEKQDEINKLQPPA
jgi:hypothetical protein